MRCLNCGAELSTTDDGYICDYCGSKYLKEELLPLSIQTSEFVIDRGIFLRYLGNEESVTIPNGVFVIGNGAFKDNLTIRKITFSKTVNEIEKNAFEGCSNLIKIENYSNIAKFGDECFKGAGLEYLEIGKNVISIGNASFSRMPNLKSIYYHPEKILKLNNAFAQCQNLSEVKEDELNFFPSLHKTVELINNPKNKKPTWGDAFRGAPFIKNIFNEYEKKLKEGFCPRCGEKLKKTLFGLSFCRSRRSYRLFANHHDRRKARILLCDKASLGHIHATSSIYYLHLSYEEGLDISPAPQRR